MRVLTTAEGDIVTLRDSVNGTLNEIYIYGKSVQNGTPTPDSPVAIESFENAEVRTSVGNLFRFPQSISKLSCDVISRTDEEAIFLVTGDGAYFSNLAYSVGVSIEYPNFFAIPISSPCKLYVDSGSQYSDTGYYSFADSKKISIVTDVATGRPFKSYTKTGGINITTDDIARGARYILVRFDFAFAPVGTEVKLRPYVGFSPMSSYEPYKEPSVLPIPYALRGLKAASGGNYTDSEGQQWVSDYVHLWKENGVVKGERVEAVYSLDVANTPKIVVSQTDYIDFRFESIPVVAGGTIVNKPLMCNKADSFANPDRSNIQALWAYASGGSTKVRFNPVANNGHWHYGTQEAFNEFVNGLFLDFVREEPSTTTIPTDQATAMLNALKTYKPTTNVIGSKPCGLSVQYKAQAPGEVELYGSSPLELPYVGGSALKSLYLKGGEITQEGVPTPDSPKPILIGGKELRVNVEGVAYVDGQEVVVNGKNLLDTASVILPKNRGTILSNEEGVIRIKVSQAGMYYSDVAYSLGYKYAEDNKAMYLIPVKKGDVIHFDSGNDLWSHNYYSLYNAERACVANNNSRPFVSVGKSGTISVAADDAAYISIRFGYNDSQIGEEYTIKPYIGYVPQGETFVPYQAPQSIPIPLLIGSDEAEITGNNPVSKGVNLYGGELENCSVLSDGTFMQGNQAYYGTYEFAEVSQVANIFVQFFGVPIGTSIAIAEYDADKNFIRRISVGLPGVNASEFILTDNTKFVRTYLYSSTPGFYSGANGNVCISESNPFTNGTYFPYEAEPQKKGVKAQRWGVYVCDGTETCYMFNASDIGNNSRRCDIRASRVSVDPYAGDALDVKCNYAETSITSKYSAYVAVGSFVLRDVDGLFRDGNDVKRFLRESYLNGNPIVFIYKLKSPTAETFAPTSPSLIKPTSVLTSYASKIDVTYKAKKAEWWKYLIGIDHDIDLTDKNVTLEALVSIISNSNPKSAIVIALPSDAYKKCVSGGGWNGTISAELAKKPLVTLALK